MTDNNDTEDHSPAKEEKRVIAILKATDNVVVSFGEGTYVGDVPLPPEAGGFNFGQNNPKIELDDGKVVYGCECWWGPVEAMKARFPSPEWKWETADIDEYRAKYVRPQVGSEEIKLVTDETHKE